jgi:ABC-type sulfate/molybdate transport systems ATPase subunit
MCFVLEYLCFKNEFCIYLKTNSCSFGLIFGRSGSGKTTLLQVRTGWLHALIKFPLHLSSEGDSLIFQLLAGLSEPTSGTICIQKYDDSGNPMGPSELLASQRVGIVFQFPERFEHRVTTFTIVFTN